MGRILSCYRAEKTEANFDCKNNKVIQRINRGSTITNYIFFLKFEFSDSEMPVYISRRVWETKDKRHYVVVYCERYDVSLFWNAYIIEEAKNKKQRQLEKVKKDLEDCKVDYTCEGNKRLYEVFDLIFKFLMASIVIFALCYFFWGKANAAEVSENLLKAISKVESRDNDLAGGDKGKALGRYQLWEGYVKDANKAGHYNFTHNDAKDASKAKRMVIAYLTHYGNRYERMTGEKATDEVLSRIHNGGPNGWSKIATVKYWNKIKKELEK